jgi:hypothetical protein
MKRIVLFVLLALGACATPYWEKPGASVAEFNQDRADCLIRANQAAPPSYSGGATFNYGSLGSVSPRTDMNSNLREEVMLGCMNNRGWAWRY